MQRENHLKIHFHCNGANVGGSYRTDIAKCALIKIESPLPINSLTQTPHVDSGAILQAQYHLRGPIESRLYIGIDFAIHIAGAAKVDDFD